MISIHSAIMGLSGTRSRWPAFLYGEMPLITCGQASGGRQADCGHFSYLAGQRLGMQGRPFWGQVRARTKRSRPPAHQRQPTWILFVALLRWPAVSKEQARTHALDDSNDDGDASEHTLESATATSSEQQQMRLTPVSASCGQAPGVRLIEGLNTLSGGPFAFNTIWTALRLMSCNVPRRRRPLFPFFTPPIRTTSLTR